jgi:hypothetical protein
MRLVLAVETECLTEVDRGGRASEDEEPQPEGHRDDEDRESGPEQEQSVVVDPVECRHLPANLPEAPGPRLCGLDRRPPGVQPVLLEDDGESVEVGCEPS